MLQYFFGWNLNFPKIKKLNTVGSNVCTCTKMWKLCYFKQNYTLELFVAFKMAYSCCFGLRGNRDFPDFLQKSFKHQLRNDLTYYFVFSDLEYSSSSSPGMCHGGQGQASNVSNVGSIPATRGVEDFDFSHGNISYLKAQLKVCDHFSATCCHHCLYG